ncbi:ABC transporter ATP-binding protein [Staphylococcus simiae]|uniref:ATP-binding cassette domain-containing protein n=1 Tax=Staphylococcus simiae TaxID=308354 RepID=UPI001A970550|nr:ATP-binding cassette domain-containing protein [Staphylococcus simiae]MBO1197822.1 ABC transporter ATP-binding protein [Staphylococcus simiae]MBO1200517.1 ABC transporter ATP-binding protein [Staphylococcus simiae]MBO1202789.1 ABC transporter ATP-binding protein [Staphylococcus simiae]MBO1211457.1 ABC transporter ATP-binding protein [Staphylococcus simiae]MBO1230211.1 ABC transporter ATP-binding protein [Staphylococcus simiae]
MSSYAVEFQHVSKRLNHQDILDNISFKIPKHSITLLEGKNGSGKSITIKLLCKLIKPNQGYIMSTNDVSYAPEYFPDNLNITIRDYFKYIKQVNRTAFQQPIFDLFISQLHIHPFLTTKLKDCSLGTRQKVNLIQCLVVNKDLYVLDEPFNALDKKSVAFIKRYLLQLKDRHTVILTCHDQDVQQLISHKVLIHNGGLIEDTSINTLRSQFTYKYVIINFNNIKLLNNYLIDMWHHIEIFDRELHIMIKRDDLNRLLVTLIHHDIEIKEVGDYNYD